jgi:exopolyphosphatase/guanosine-5'-triphosphate,3'-diphosphate pyrophosphatase
VDIGGGSTEFIIGTGLKPHERESLHMGCVNFSRRFFADGAVDKGTLKVAEMAARVEVERIARGFSRNNWQQAVGSSGTARALREILEQNGWSARGITADGLAKLRTQLLKAGHVDALELAGLARDRRPVIAGGFAIMAGLFAELDIEQMDVAETAMREGILYDLLGRFHKQDMREATVEEFTRRYHIDTQQAARIKRVAHKLLAACGARDENTERILDWAARLHEIGLSVSHSGYHRHSGYILENADMPGFSRRDQSRLASLVRASRGGLGKLGYSPGDQNWPLILCLRLAVLFNSGRNNPSQPKMQLTCNHGACNLHLPAAWLKANLLTQAALDDELKAWREVGPYFRLEQLQTD